MSLNGNAVIPVLFFNTLISSLLFLPFIVLSYTTDCLDGTLFYVPHVSFQTHVAVFIKAVIVLSSWIFGYFALKHLPLTISGPIKATQPVLTLLGALIIFGEERGNPVHTQQVDLFYGAFGDSWRIERVV